MLDFTGVKSITIPEGNVNKIISGGTLIWEKLTGLLPFPYQQVEYITMDGAQGIVYKEPFTDITENIWTFAPTEFYGSYIGGSYTSGNTSYLNLRQSKSGQLIETYVGEVVLRTPALTLNNIYTLTTKADNQALQLAVSLEQNGSVLYSNSASITTVTSSYTSLDFGVGCNGYLVGYSGTAGRFENSACFRGKVYSYQHKCNNILVRDFIPCYRITDGVIGMYDTVTKTFFTNAGIGSFTKGENV